MLCIRDNSPTQRGLGKLHYLPGFSLQCGGSHHHYGERAGHAQVLHLWSLLLLLTQV